MISYSTKALHTDSGKRIPLGRTVPGELEIQTHHNDMKSFPLTVHNTQLKEDPRPRGETRDAAP